MPSTPSRARQRIALTGTLITNSAVDLYGQFLAVGYGNDRPKRERNQMFLRWRGRHFVDLLAGAGVAVPQVEADHPDG